MRLNNRACLLGRGGREARACVCVEGDEVDLCLHGLQQAHEASRIVQAVVHAAQHHVLHKHDARAVAGVLASVPGEEVLERCH